MIWKWILLYIVPVPCLFIHHLFFLICSFPALFTHKRETPRLISRSVISLWSVILQKRIYVFLAVHLCLLSVFVLNLFYLLFINKCVCFIPQDPDMFWDFITLRPETTHQVSFLFSDRGTPDGYRRMNGYGSHTFKLVNKEGKPVYCKFHWKVNYKICAVF